MYRLVAAPIGHVLSLEQVKDHVRVDRTDADHDSTLTALIGVVEAQIEAALGRKLLTQSFEASFERPDARGRLLIDFGPFRTMTKLEALQSGTYVTLAEGLDYVVRRLDSERTILRPPNATPTTKGAWPPYDRDEAAFKASFELGYGAAADVPAPIVQAMLLEIGDLFTNRDASRPAAIVDNPAAMRLLSPFRATPV